MVRQERIFTFLASDACAKRLVEDVRLAEAPRRSRATCRTLDEAGGTIQVIVPSYWRGGHSSHIPRS